MIRREDNDNGHLRCRSQRAECEALPEHRTKLGPCCLSSPNWSSSKILSPQGHDCFPMSCCEWNDERRAASQGKIKWFCFLERSTVLPVVISLWDLEFKRMKVIFDGWCVWFRHKRNWQICTGFSDLELCKKVSILGITFISNEHDKAVDPEGTGFPLPECLRLHKTRHTLLLLME